MSQIKWPSTWFSAHRPPNKIHFLLAKIYSVDYFKKKLKVWSYLEVAPVPTPFNQLMLRMRLASSRKDVRTRRIAQRNNGGVVSKCLDPSQMRKGRTPSWIHPHTHEHTQETSRKRRTKGFMALHDIAKHSISKRRWTYNIRNGQTRVDYMQSEETNNL
jgi:hypothetical protein